MKKIFVLCTVLVASISYAQDIEKSDLTREVEQLKQAVNELRNNETQSDRAKYQRNYQMVLYGIEIIKEIHQGTIEISAARSQNILYKKLMDINNPTSDALGFQLGDVIDKSLEANLSSLVVGDGDKKRLRGQVSSLVEGVKKIFPPFQILSSAVSMISSFPVFQSRIEKVGRRADSIVTDVIYPITKEILGKFNGQLEPYMSFYNELTKLNSKFENALYQHVVEYKDFVEEVYSLKGSLEKNVNLNSSMEQINTMFDLSNSSNLNFNYKQMNDNPVVGEMTAICVNVFDFVVRFKKFANDFIVIQDDFYRDNTEILEQKAKRLPIKDEAKIDKLIAELKLIQKGDPSNKVIGFDEGYKQRMNSIAAKLIGLNKTRLR